MQVKNVGKIHIPPLAGSILGKLTDNGYEAYVVGGCVRDGILSRNPGDWDIATNAKPCDIKLLFPKTIDTGIKHGTVTVVLQDESFEVTTYRVDGKYVDHRRPESVKFTSSLTEDLCRRDFTINAIAYNPCTGFVDPFMGLKDINAGIIRAVGNPDARFKEDALRMLRAVRFAAQLDFNLDEETFVSIKHNSSLISKVSPERIRDELNKILTSPRPEKFEMLRDTRLLHYIMPEFLQCFNTLQNHPYHVYDVAQHILNSVSKIKNDRVLRWTMLLHDIGKPLTKTTDQQGIDHFYNHGTKSTKLAEKILQRLKFDKKTFQKICRLVHLHDIHINPQPKSIRKIISKIGDKDFPDLLLVKEADYSAQNPECLEGRLRKLEDIRKIYQDIIASDQCTNLKNLAINGNDLTAMGFLQGKEIGKILNTLLEYVIENPELNNKETLLKLLKNFEH